MCAIELLKLMTNTVFLNEYWEVHNSRFDLCETEVPGPDCITERIQDYIDRFDAWRRMQTMFY